MSANTSWTDFSAMTSWTDQSPSSSAPAGLRGGSCLEEPIVALVNEFFPDANLQLLLGHLDRCHHIGMRGFHRQFKFLPKHVQTPIAANITDQMIAPVPGFGQGRLRGGFGGGPT